MDSVWESELMAFGHAAFQKTCPSFTWWQQLFLVPSNPMQCLGQSREDLCGCNCLKTSSPNAFDLGLQDVCTDLYGGCPSNEGTPSKLWISSLFPFQATQHWPHTLTATKHEKKQIRSMQHWPIRCSGKIPWKTNIHLVDVGRGAKILNF